MKVSDVFLEEILEIWAEVNFEQQLASLQHFKTKPMAQFLNKNRKQTNLLLRLVLKRHYQSKTFAKTGMQ